MEKTQLLQRICAGIFLILFAIGPWLIHGRTPWTQGCVVWIFDVGQGDSIFLDCPEAQILIDGGPSQTIIEELTWVLPFWDRSIDIIINTHPHADHVRGLVSVMERFDVGEVWTTGQVYSSAVFTQFQEEMKDREVYVQAGMEHSLGDGIVLHVVWPTESLRGKRLEDPNSGSVVVEVVGQSRSLLLTGDIGVEQERAISDRLGSVTYLKVGHQGSLTSSDPTFIDLVDPEVAIISVGENDYGHPHPIVLDRYKQRNIPVWRTDQDGSYRIDLF